MQDKSSVTFPALCKHNSARKTLDDRLYKHKVDTVSKISYDRLYKHKVGTVSKISDCQPEGPGFNPRPGRGLKFGRPSFAIQSVDRDVMPLV